MPDPRATSVAAGIPMSATTTTSTMATGMRAEMGKKSANPAHRSVVTADAQVPGPGRMCPIPKKVATRLAHEGARRDSELSI